MVKTIIVSVCKYTFMSDVIKIAKSWKTISRITSGTLEGPGPILKVSTLFITFDL